MCGGRFTDWPRKLGSGLTEIIVIRGERERDEGRESRYMYNCYRDNEDYVTEQEGRKII